MLLTGLEILTMCPGEEPVTGAIRIDGDRIAAIGALSPLPGEEVVDASGLTALPGFVQGHVHLCQTLFRGAAEDLALLDWLERRIWPLEAAHDETSLRLSARLAVHELAAGGTTTFQSMETVHGTQHVLDEVLQSGLRGVLGNALMDVGDTAPPGFVQSTKDALATAERLASDWDGRGGRLHFAFNPRFLLSCSEDLLRELARRRGQGARVHTHASEHPSELEAVQAAHGRRYVQVLADLDLLGPTTSLAHCVHLDDGEHELLRSSGASVLHCPSTNLKLGSGIAPITRYVADGVAVALGADGAPANNRLDALTELRQAALLQCWKAGPGALTAEQAVALVTREAARALGLEQECGTLEPGKAADLVLIDLRDLGPGGDPFTRIVYGADRGHIRSVLAGGAWLVRDGIAKLPLPDAGELRSCFDALCARAHHLS